MQSTLTIPTAAALVVLAAASPGLAANCAARDTVVDRLSDGYGEAFAGGGLRDSASIFEVWTSDDGGTWTILLTTPDGMSCVMASGTDWRDALPSERERLAGIPG